jgi:hypothetical protein
MSEFHCVSGSEATESIAFAFALIFSSPFSAQKSHVKPQSHLTHFRTTTSAWRISYVRIAILDTGIKKEETKPAESR